MDADDRATRPQGRLRWLEPFAQIKGCRDVTGVMKAERRTAAPASQSRG